MTGTMLTDRGQEYVATWPTKLATKMRLSSDWVVVALQRARLLTDDQYYEYCRAFTAQRYTDLVGNMTRETTQEVIAHLKNISRELNQAEATTCRCCGLTLQNGPCPACDNA